MKGRVVTRFAPSPTGYLHVGNVRTALLNFLFARKFGGRFRLRIEDTDKKRCERRFVNALYEDLRWLGLAWDDDVVFQSERKQDHLAALEALQAKGAAYRCFCSQERLALDRKLARAKGETPRYVGRCRGLDPQVAEERARAGEPHVWRLAAHADWGEVVVPDFIREQVVFHRSDLDDPVLVRADASFTFLLPNVVDDATDGVTHVLRGDDHLTNSAYQVFILQQLGTAVPTYLHHGLLLDEQGKKFSKREKGMEIRMLRSQGLLAEALLQALVRLGHPNLPERPLTLEELIRYFEPERLSLSPARWSMQDAWRWNQRVIQSMDEKSLSGLLKECFPHVEEARLQAFARLIKGNIRSIHEARDYARLLNPSHLLEEGDRILRDAGVDVLRIALIEWEKQGDYAAWIKGLKRLTGRKGKALFLPLRAALMGKASGPALEDAVAFLGYEGVCVRLREAIARLSEG